VEVREEELGETEDIGFSVNIFGDVWIIEVDCNDELLSVKGSVVAVLVRVGRI